MKKHIYFSAIFSLLLLITVSRVHAQLDVQSYANSVQAFLTEASSKSGNTTYSNLGDYTGSPFLFKNFKRAVVYTSIGQKKGVEFFNFDIYSNRYVISEEDGVTAQKFIWLDEKQVDKVAVQDEDRVRFFVVEPIFKDGSKSGIVELLYSNGKDIRIVREHTAVYSKASQTNTGYGTSGSKARFRDNDKTFALLGTNEPMQLKKDKDLVKIFGDKSKDALKWMKQNKLDWDNPSDLERLFAEFAANSK
jgi:hypothetical protein